MNSFLPEISYPIILSPMLGIVTPKMVATVSNLGGLGMLPLGGQSTEKAAALIDETMSLTRKPFGVNLFILSEPDLSVNLEKVEKMRCFIEKIVRDKGWADHYDFDYHFYPYQDLIDLIIKKGIKIVSFTFGVLPESYILRLKSKGIFLIGNATCLQEALLLEQAGADAIIAQGIEAGGHRCSFIEGEVPKVGLFPLLSQITGSVKIPVFGAGGIHDEKTIKAALNLGAKAVQIGSHFMLSEESLTPKSFYPVFENATATSTALTKAFSGRWARGIQNLFMEKVVESGLEIPDYPIQNVLTRPMRNFAKKNNDSEFNSMWAGQNIHFAKPGTTADIMMYLINSYKKIKI